MRNKNWPDRSARCCNSGPSIPDTWHYVFRKILKRLPCRERVHAKQCREIRTVSDSAEKVLIARRKIHQTWDGAQDNFFPSKCCLRRLRFLTNHILEDNIEIQQTSKVCGHFRIRTSNSPGARSPPQARKDWADPKMFDNYGTKCTGTAPGYILFGKENILYIGVTLLFTTCFTNWITWLVQCTLYYSKNYSSY